MAKTNIKHKPSGEQGSGVGGMGHKTKILDTVRGRVRVRDAVAGLLRRQTNKSQKKKKKQSQKRERGGRREGAKDDRTHLGP